MWIGVGYGVILIVGTAMFYFATGRG